jgi:hypothetical protein
MTRKVLFATLVAALMSVNCSNLLDELKNTTSSSSPSTTGAQSLNGTWASVSSVTTEQNTCTNFRWTVTDFSNSTGTGSFTATCLSNMAIAGTATGMLTGSTVTWTATAVGLSPAGDSCPISLNGTAVLDNDQIRVPFSGTTCAGAISGTEILRR